MHANKDESGGTCRIIHIMYGLPSLRALRNVCEHFGRFTKSFCTTYVTPYLQTGISWIGYPFNAVASTCQTIWCNTRAPPEVQPLSTVQHLQWGKFADHQKKDLAYGHELGVWPESTSSEKIESVTKDTTRQRLQALDASDPITLCPVLDAKVRSFQHHSGLTGNPTVDTYTFAKELKPLKTLEVHA